MGKKSPADYRTEWVDTVRNTQAVLNNWKRPEICDGSNCTRSDMRVLVWVHNRSRLEWVWPQEAGEQVLESNANAGVAQPPRRSNQRTTGER